MKIKLFLSIGLFMFSMVLFPNGSRAASWTNPFSLYPGSSDIGRVELFVHYVSGSSVSFETPGADNFSPPYLIGGIINPTYINLTGFKPSSATESLTLHYSGDKATQVFYEDYFFYDPSGALIWDGRSTWNGISFAGPSEYNALNPSDPAYIRTPSVAAVPEPTTILLLGSGLIGLAGYGRKKFFKK